MTAAALHKSKITGTTEKGQTEDGEESTTVCHWRTIITLLLGID